MDHALPREEGRKGLALTISIVFHSLLLLGFIAMKIVTPLPPYPPGGGEGMALGIADIGYSLEGLGDSESMEESGAVEQAAPQPQPESSEEFITEDDGEAVNQKPDPVKKPETVKPVTKPVNKPPKISEPTVDKRITDALNTWNKPGKVEGGGTKPGDPGKPDGTLGAGGVFHGNGWELRGSGTGPNGNGRGLARGPDLSEKPELQNATWVEVTVMVDKQGNVTRTPSASGPGSTNTVIKEVAMRAAKSCRFVPLPNGPPEQQFIIRLNFSPG